jgi:tRNA-modifying protein YgfZ
MIVDQSDWGQLRVTGEDRQRFLQGMLTCDIAALAPGGFARGAVLNVKGRVLAVIDIVLEGDAYVVLTEPVTAAKLREVLEKHAIVDDVVFSPETRPLHRVWESPAAVWTAPPIFAPAVGAAGAREVEVRRVEAGLPRYGVDVSEEHFPFEANLDSAISYTKGCYIGQEVVARAHARGHANKRLVGLRLEGEGPLDAGTPLAAPGRDQAGQITSSVVSPAFGPIALAYLHRSAWEPGTVVRAGGRAATVAGLPFGDAPFA